ncbi:MAG: undecaprenyl-diphosphate phosphatase [Candidatus Omnitrophota bacterium]
MKLIEALISGLVQGIAEFLPISSSGHLVLVHKFFGFSEPGMFFDISLHAATLGSVIIYLRKDLAAIIRGKNIRLILYLFVATVPAVLAGLLFESKVEEFFTSSYKVAYMFMVTGAVLFAGQIALSRKEKAVRELNFRNSLFIGIAQACAIFPGISRSGVTISSGISSGLEKDEAFRFSFLLMIPVVAGAALYKAMSVDFGALSHGQYMNYAAGMGTAFFTGICCLHILRKILREKKLYIFAVYCLILGLFCLFIK